MAQQQTDSESQEISKLLEIGLSLEAINASIAFCVKHDKTQTLREIKTTMKTFMDSLTEAEAHEFAQDLDQAMKRKADQLADELSLQFSDEELNLTMTKLKDAFTQPGKPKLFSK